MRRLYLTQTRPSAQPATQKRRSPLTSFRLRHYRDHSWVSHLSRAVVRLLGLGIHAGRPYNGLLVLLDQRTATTAPTDAEIAEAASLNAVLLSCRPSADALQNARRTDTYQSSKGGALYLIAWLVYGPGKNKQRNGGGAKVRSSVASVRDLGIETHTEPFMPLEAWSPL